MQLQQLVTLHSWHENFVANRPKLCGNYAFPQNFHTRKLVEITVFFAVGVFLPQLKLHGKNIARGVFTSLSNI